MNRPQWTPNENELISQLFLLADGVRQISEATGKSEKAVSTRAWRMGIKKRPGANRVIKGNYKDPEIFIRPGDPCSCGQLPFDYERLPGTDYYDALCICGHRYALRRVED